VINLFDDLPARANHEEFTEVLARQGVRIETDRLNWSVYAG
jgi:hypothetical protein